MEQLDYLRVIWRYKWLLLALAAGLGAASFLRTRSMPPVYEATAKVVIRPTSALGLLDTLPQFSIGRVFDYAEIFRSRTFLRRFAAPLIGKPDPTPEQLAWLRANVSAQPIPGSNTIDLRYRAHGADGALAGLVHLTEGLAQYSRELQQRDLNFALRTVQVELSRQEAQGQGGPKGGDLAMTLISRLQQSAAALRIAHAACRGEVEIIEEPMLLGNIVQERTLFNLCVGIFWGLVLGAGLAFLLDHLRHAFPARLAPGSGGGR